MTRAMMECSGTRVEQAECSTPEWTVVISTCADLGSKSIFEASINGGHITQRRTKKKNVPYLEPLHLHCQGVQYHTVKGSNKHWGCLQLC